MPATHDPPAHPRSLPLPLHPVTILLPPASDRAWATAPHPRLPLAATCAADKAVRIYSLAGLGGGEAPAPTTQALHSTVAGGHKRSVRACAWKPAVPGTEGARRNGSGESLLATASFDATVGIWRRWEREEGNDDGVGGDKEKPKRSGVVNIMTGEIEDEEDEEEEEERDADADGWHFAVLLDGHDSEVKGIAWSHTGAFLATCGRDKSVWIWEHLPDPIGGSGSSDDFETIAVLTDHTADVKTVAWHPADDVLASAGYDDTVRLWRQDPFEMDDWTQAACLRGHEGTVWGLAFESAKPITPKAPESSSTTAGNTEGIKPSEQKGWDMSALINHWHAVHARSGPRLASASADGTIRIWRRIPPSKQQPPTTPYSAVPSIIRPVGGGVGDDEAWEVMAVLPCVHDLPVYAVAWSPRSGLVASAGADGRVVVYVEQFSGGEDSCNDGKTAGNEGTNGAKNDEPLPSDAEAEANANADISEAAVPRTTFSVLAVAEAAHGVYEINHVCWANTGADGGGREVLLSTGDDGAVRVWKVEV